MNIKALKDIYMLPALLLYIYITVMFTYNYMYSKAVVTIYYTCLCNTIIFFKNKLDTHALAYDYIFLLLTNSKLILKLHFREKLV